MTTVLSTRGLSKSYGQVQALKGVDLDVQKGEVFGFLGPNGAGKTTFTKLVTGFVRPDAGTVEVMGKDALHDPTKVAHHIGLVPDQYDFYSNLTGRQHLDFYGRLVGMPDPERKRRIGEVLALVRMEERADTRTKGYSHGMKQRICIAQALLHEPELVLFDEPTNGLDPQGAYELRQMILGLARQGTTVFLNSHQIHEVQEICGRVAIMDRGSVLKIAPVSQLRAGAGTQSSIKVLNPSKTLAGKVQKAVAGAQLAEDGTISVPGQGEALATSVAAIVAAGGKVIGVQQEQATLEQIFLELTGAQA